MNIYPPTARNRTGKLAVLFAFLIAVSTTTALAQQKVSRNFPAGKAVRLELKNLSGTITVETWPKDEIRITATMESPAAHFNPRQTEAGLVIDIVGDNRGRGDVGDMNFKIQVPARTSVDLETRRGQINVSNIQGDLVRAHISTSGDVTLSGLTRPASLPRTRPATFSSMENLPPAGPMNSSPPRETSPCSWIRCVRPKAWPMSCAM